MTNTHTSKDANRVIICDTTLAQNRDSTITPPPTITEITQRQLMSNDKLGEHIQNIFKNSMSFDEKLWLARTLEALGVDVIECGNPSIVASDFRTTQGVASIAVESIVSATARPRTKDIERTIEALKPARHSRINLASQTSPIHMKELGIVPKSALETIRDSIGLIRDHVSSVEWSAQDATRSDFDFLCRCIETAIKAGARTIDIPDTAGCLSPSQYGEFITKLQNTVANIDQAILSVDGTLEHRYHNPRSLIDETSVIDQTIQGIKAGARQAKCDIGGLDHTSLEEVLINFRSGGLTEFTNGVTTTSLKNSWNFASGITRDSTLRPLRSCMQKLARFDGVDLI